MALPLLPFPPLPSRPSRTTFSVKVFLTTHRIPSINPLICVPFLLCCFSVDNLSLSYSILVFHLSFPPTWKATLRPASTSQASLYTQYLEQFWVNSHKSVLLLSKVWPPSLSFSVLNQYLHFPHILTWMGFLSIWYRIFARGYLFD